MNRLWLPMISVIFNCPLSKLTLTGLLSKSNSIAPWPELQFYCPFGRNHPLCQLLELFLLLSLSDEKTIIHLMSCDWHWSWISFNSFFSWANFHLHLWATYIGFCHLNWINFKCFLSLILSIIFWAEYSLHISITVQVSPLLNEDLLSRTSPPSFPCLRQSGDSSCCFMRHTIN